MTDPVLTAFVDAAVPADDHPSARDSGALSFLAALFAGELSESSDRLATTLERVDATAVSVVGCAFAAATDEQRERALTALADDPDVRWLLALVADGYYADAANGGNRDEASWRMLDFDPRPAGGWPPPARSVPESGVLDGPGAVADRYDAIVVGSGAGGGTTACVLAEAGYRVLVVERGSWPGADELWGDHLRNARAEVGFDPRSGPPTAGNPRVLDGETIWPTDPRWGNNAMTAGGGTRVYGAQAWRYGPLDFRMASSYGVPAGSALADWPIGYDELEPYYHLAEVELGVSGRGGGAWAGHRSRDFPMPPLGATRATDVLGAGATRLGLGTVPVPLLINSVDHGGRSACRRCGACVGFACPVEAKSGSHNTVLARALATGRCEVLLGAVVERVTTDAGGRVDGVALVGESGGPGAAGLWRRTVRAEEVVLAAGAVETARLLLNSAHDREPTGLGNDTDQVGRHLQGHIYAAAIGLFDEVVVDGLGPGPSIATGDYRHRNPGVVGGGMLANEFVPTPVSTYHYLTGAGLIPRHGLRSKQGMRDYFPRMQRIVGPVHEVTSASSRVRVGTTVDRFGIPVAQFSGSVHPEDLTTQAFLTARAGEWLEAAGARTVRTSPPRAPGMGPSSGTHQAGTCRMGDDPATSVTDPIGRVWGHDNLRVADASTHVTNGGVNPVLTIFANAFRIAHAMTKPSPAMVVHR